QLIGEAQYPAHGAAHRVRDEKSIAVGNEESSGRAMSKRDARSGCGLILECKRYLKVPAPARAGENRGQCKADFGRVVSRQGLCEKHHRGVAVLTGLCFQTLGVKPERLLYSSIAKTSVCERTDRQHDQSYGGDCQASKLRSPHCCKGLPYLFCNPIANDASLDRHSAFVYPPVLLNFVPRHCADLVVDAYGYNLL